MTSQAPPAKLDYGKIAAALAALRVLLIAGNVVIRDLWHSSPDHDLAAEHGRVVEITIEGQPAALDAILTGMTNRSEPNHWYGNHYAFNEWRGHLMTMPVLVIERIARPLPPPEPAAAAEPVTYPPLPEGARASCADHPGFVPDSLQHLREHIETYHDDEVAGAKQCMCEQPGVPCPLHGEVAWDEVDPSIVRPYIQTDTRPLLELALDERFGPARGPVAPIEVISGPEVPGDQLVDQFARAQGVVPVVPGRSQEAAAEFLRQGMDPERLRRVESAWSQYARARAMHHFGDRRFPSMAAAREAIAYWPGADMLSPEDTAVAAGALVDPPRTPEPAERSRRLFSIRTRREA